MGLVLWIDQNSFATSLIEKVFKKKQLPFYTIESVEDFSYLVDDLNPVVIVLDGATFNKNVYGFIKQYQNSPKMQSLPFILLDFDGDESFIKHKIGTLKKPIEAFKLPDQLSKIMQYN